jgi:hypothetical protein
VTVREMLMFTLFHFDHHRENVARRLEARHPVGSLFSHGFGPVRGARYETPCEPTDAADSR